VVPGITEGILPLGVRYIRGHLLLVRVRVRVRVRGGGGRRREEGGRLTLATR